MIKVATFYKFFPIEKSKLESLQEELKAQGTQLGVRGLILLAEEGINATISGSEESIKKYKEQLNSLFNQDFFYKDSECGMWNFKMLSVKIKDEIVSIGATYPNLKESNQHLSPQEWEEKIKNDKDVQILDVRNVYEIELGKFEGAKDLNMDTFGEFPDKIKDSKLDKEKDTLIYCTGGIRCEKAIEIMKDKGFKNIYQLEGGILNYLKNYPDSQFKEECFVFDHRVSVDQNLESSKKYKLCPHCGQPAQKVLECLHCFKEAAICEKCLDLSKNNQTCSKNCKYHFKHQHKCKKPENKKSNYRQN